MEQHGYMRRNSASYILFTCSQVPLSERKRIAICVVYYLIHWDGNVSFVLDISLGEFLLKDTIYMSANCCKVDLVGVGVLYALVGLEILAVV